MFKTNTRASPDGFIDFCLCQQSEKVDFIPTNYSSGINLTILLSISYHLQDHACPLPLDKSLQPCIGIFITKSLSFPSLFLETLGNFSISGHSCKGNLFNWLIWFFLKKKQLQLFCIQLYVFPWIFIFPWIHPWCGSSPFSLYSVFASYLIGPFSYLRWSAFTPFFFLKPSCTLRIVSQIM